MSLSCAGPTSCRDKLLAARGWTVLSVPYFQWMQCQGQLVLQQDFICQLLLKHVEIGPYDRQEDLKPVGRSTDSSNASTDDDESCATALHSL